MTVHTGSRTTATFSRLELTRTRTIRDDLAERVMRAKSYGAGRLDRKGCPNRTTTRNPD